MVTQTDVYTIFNHNDAIAGINKGQYCTVDATTDVLYDGRAASATPFYLKRLTVDLPAEVLADTVQLLGRYYRSLVKSSLTRIDSVVIGTVMYRSYRFDPTVFNTPAFYSLFRTADGGGLLGEIEFTSTYVSALTGLESVLTLRVKIFIPPVPVLTRDVNGLNSANANQYCEDLGNLKITGLPSPAAGKRTVSFQLNKFNPGTNTYVPVSSLGVLTNLGDGTALIDTKAAVTQFGYDSLRVDYLVHSVISGCDAIASTSFRLTPNPVANFTLNRNAACEGSSIQFTDNASISTAKPDFAIVAWNWNFDDPNYVTPTNPNIVSAATGAALSHQYTHARIGGYQPSLTVVSNYGCVSNVKTRNISIGGTPVVGFTYSGVAAPILLQNTSTVFEGTPFDSVKFYYRKRLLTPITSVSDTVFKYLTSGPQLSGSPGTYDVKLRVVSQVGCASTLTKKVVILPLKQLTTVKPYLETFEGLDSGYWQIGPDTLASSWRVGRPGAGKSVLKTDPAINGNKVWYTGKSGSYHPKEKSYLYTNVFDISNLDLPMVNFNSFVQMEQSDGVVLQYSLDNKNIADTTKVWNVLGSFEDGISSGIEWYNGQGLASKPGGQFTKDYGWTGSSSTGWKMSSHSLDEIAGAKRVVFRFALGSVKANPTLDGFAIDNFWIRSRTRTVLVESFFNTANTKLFNGTNAEKSQSDAIRAFQKNREGVEVIKLNYHVNFPGLDPFNSDYPAAPSSRALYYNLTGTPVSMLDGFASPSKPAFYFSQWGQQQFGLRTLKSGQAIIGISPLAGYSSLTDKGVVSLNINVTAVETLPANTILNIAVVEQTVTLPNAADKQALVLTGEKDFVYVVKTLLPSAGGTSFNTSMPALSSRQFGPFIWTPDARKFYSTGKGNLAVVVFLQNEDTKEIYQSAMIGNLDYPDPVTAIEPLELGNVLVYPNPANKDFTIALPGVARTEMPFSMVDQFGVVAESGIIEAGQMEKTVHTETLAAGLYILQIGNKKNPVSIRVMVIH